MCVGKIQELKPSLRMNPHVVICDSAGGGGGGGGGGRLPALSSCRITNTLPAAGTHLGPSCGHLQLCQHLQVSSSMLRWRPVHDGDSRSSELKPGGHEEHEEHEERDSRCTLRTDLWKHTYMQQQQLRAGWVFTTCTIFFTWTHPFFMFVMTCERFTN